MMQGPNMNPLFKNNSNNDDFLKQMLSNVPSSSSSSSSWIGLDPSSEDAEHANLTSKFGNHQISDNDKASSLMLHHQLLLSSLHSFNSPTPPTDQASNSLQPLYNAFSPSLQPSNQSQQPQSFGAAAPAPPRQRVRARRGQATDPHSIAERLRRERIAERMKALQELVPNANKTDKASMLDEIIDYVKFLQLQVKVLSMSRLGGATAVAPLVADISTEGGGECIESNSNDRLSMTEQQVAKLMAEDMGSAMQYLQGKGLCLMPISLATSISKVTCHTTNPFFNAQSSYSPALTVPNGIVKDATSVSKSS